MSRKKFIAGNWKMFKTVAEALAFGHDAKARVAGVDKVQIAIGVPFTALHALAHELKDSNIELAAQNCHWEKEGAFTGEISVAMLKEAGAKHVIIAHSERRQYFGETNATANLKVKAALAGGLGVILCVGEKLEEREAGRAFEVVKDHLDGGLQGLSAADMERVVIAYEPVWAIGTGKTATPAQAQEVHAFIRARLKEIMGAAVADSVRIQYGGSVKPDNVRELMAQLDIDGALVGGASLKPESFEALVKF
ncbi:MAG TPA: triose-phosphate isomerase [bacterium]|jgi:triosephosphate isomerase|nr:triose-phosphate isomerase [bacterium]